MGVPVASGKGGVKVLEPTEWLPVLRNDATQGVEWVLAEVHGGLTTWSASEVLSPEAGTAAMGVNRMDYRGRLPHSFLFLLRSKSNVS